MLRCYKCCIGYGIPSVVSYGIYHINYKKTPSDGFSESSGPDLVASLVNAAATAVEMATPSLPGRVLFSSLGMSPMDRWIDR